MLAMEVNDYAGRLDASGAWASIASVLAPTGGRVMLRYCQFVGVLWGKLNPRRQNAPASVNAGAFWVLLAARSQAECRTISTCGIPASRNSSLTMLNPRRS